MEILQSILLGIVQGLTEFLPVSSSAHLDVIPHLFKMRSMLLNSLTFDVALHGGTLLALLVFYWKKIIGLLYAFFRGLADKAERETADFRMAIFLIIATVPALIVAVLFDKYIEGALRNPVYTGAMLIIFGIVLWLADRAGSRQKDNSKMTVPDSIIIGAAQALSVIPGVSRSGITMTASLFRGFKREDAAEFAFLMSAPAIFGALVFKLKAIIKTGSDGSSMVFIAGFLASALAGFATIKFMLYFVRKNSFTPFVVYRIAAGVLILALAFTGGA